jgi:hypothetical protein
MPVKTGLKICPFRHLPRAGGDSFDNYNPRSGKKHETFNESLFLLFGTPAKWPLAL